MPPAAVARPNVLTDPGFLFIAPLGSSEPTNTVAGSVFTDSWPVAWLPLGATADGSTFAYSTSIEPVEVAEFFDPISFYTTSRSGSFAFNLANWGLTNYRRALNGGAASLAPTSGTGATALYKVEPPDPGQEVRVMLGWESITNDLRLVVRQSLQGGEISAAFQKAPTLSTIPCTFQLEVPTSGAKPFALYGAGAARG